MTFLHLLILFLIISCLEAFISLGGNYYEIPRHSQRFHSFWMLEASTSSSSSPSSPPPSVGDLLCDLPTPSLLLELSLGESAIVNNNSSSTFVSLDEILLNCHHANNSSNIEEIEKNSLLDGSIFIHTKVINTSIRDAITEEQGSGKSHVICQVDATTNLTPGGSFLGIGLANHHVGGYYWARGMGMGASLPAHGIHVRPVSGDGGAQDGNADYSYSELYWKKRGPGSDAMETTEESSNSNDGKRSEWADFLVIGDTVQLVPEHVASVLNDSPFQFLLGVRRIGRPLGADPIVEKIWIRSENGWIPKL